ncbi:hypothetical protein [Nevskia ramosa]|uniref:hypothetical protein n=1 Tax=Nevskia ramosa TaxID=64002 RepID=UPI0003B674BB|nr:hypothetical protein [Nevskia ramosa]
MEMRPQLQIQTVIKAMMEDVIPAMDQTNQLAMQSAQLTIGTLMLISQHLPLEYRYDCDELARLLATAKTLATQAGGLAAAGELAVASRAGADVLDRARAEPSEILDAIRSLRAATADTVRAVYAEGSDSVQASVEKTVLAMSREQLLRDRSWLLMQGWEPNPALVPAIDTLLAPIPKG